MFSKINDFCKDLTTQFDEIPEERKIQLAEISNYIQSKIDSKLTINIMYVCTHNSRRSHFGQVMAEVAANFYGISNVKAYSGGTEATVFNPNAIQALKHIGFEIDENLIGNNPIYIVKHDETLFTVCFSKKYDHLYNPSVQFAAIMTCEEADNDCPYIIGAERRIPTTYEDPKKFDNSPQEAKKYLERATQIALETFYVFSKLQ